MSETMNQKQIDANLQIPVRAGVLAHVRKYLEGRPYGEVASLVRLIDNECEAWAAETDPDPKRDD